MSEYTAFPLNWPAGWPREKYRKDAPFHRRVQRDGQAWATKDRLTIEQARTAVRGELRKLGASGVVISSNLRLRLDGEPMSGQSNPDDPGVCVYFKLNNKPRCLPCDRWKRAADNLMAIAKYVEAMRGQIRWGVGSVDAMFAGFKALPGAGDSLVTPPPMSVEEAARLIAEWSSQPTSTPRILSDPGTFKSLYRVLALRLHPDSNGGATSSTWLHLQQAAEVLRQHHAA